MQKKRAPRCILRADFEFRVFVGIMESPSGNFRRVEPLRALLRDRFRVPVSPLRFFTATPRRAL
jgi:hypothetical protein